MTIIDEEKKTLRKVDDYYVSLCVEAFLPVGYALSRGLTEEDLLNLIHEPIPEMIW